MSKIKTSVSGYWRDKEGDKVNPVAAADARLGKLRENLSKELDLRDISINRVLNESVGNIEQPIGCTIVPMGIAGPLMVSSASGKREYHVPISTTEGALVASIQRGMKVIGLSGGARVIADDVGITRAPVFAVDGLKQGSEVISWIKSNISDLKKVALGNSSHLKLIDISPTLMGKYLYIRIRFDTGEAMGMNMATYASQRIVEYLEKQVGLRCISLSSNMCADKKPAWINPIAGRGVKTQAEVLIPAKVLSSQLRVDVGLMMEVIQAKNYVGSQLAGTMGSNAQVANVVAGLFLATGQDMAHVVDSSVGFVSAQNISGDLYMSLLLPNLIVGTVGGGTQLPTQRNALKILGLDSCHEGDKEKLAEVIVATALAAEVSLTAALASGDLAKSHYLFTRQD